MRDFTKGPIIGHLVAMGLFIAFTMLIQTAYFLVDLYFVSRLGKEAVAGVSAAGAVFLLAMGFSQVIGVGVTALVSRAVGGGDTRGADLLFNQSIGMAIAAGLIALALGYSLGIAFVDRMGADAGASAAAREYLTTFLPSLALMFPMASLGSALRAAGVIREPTLVQTGSLLLNIVLAPVLIAGWGTGVPLGVAGAGLASTISVAAAFFAMIAIFPRTQKMMRWRGDFITPRLSEWGRLLGVGLPSGAEFLLMFVIMAVVYFVIRSFGAEAQAGFGIGSRVLQSVMLPAMAVAFSAAPIIGQNLGAGSAARVRETLFTALAISTAIMIALSLSMHVNPSALTSPFSPDAEVLRNANLYLQIISWNLVAAGIVFTCSGVFQGLGDTTPSLISSASRLLTFVAPALWLRSQPGVTLEHFWWLSCASSILQALFSLWLMRGALRRKTGALTSRAQQGAS